jgi:hypothetical protein
MFVPPSTNFDCALLVCDGRIESTEQVSAQGHEETLFYTLSAATVLR